MAIFPKLSQMPKHSYPRNAHPVYSLVGVWTAIVTSLYKINGVLVSLINKIDDVSIDDVDKVDNVKISGGP
jgi:hypothetical protein